MSSHTDWYGHAKHRPMQVHSSKTWETAVGGTRNEIRAIYGSTDNAMQDHRNDPLCHIVDDATGMRDNKPYVPTTQHSFYTVTTTVAPDAERTASLIRRAIARNMTLVDYCAMVGQPLY